MTRKYIGNITMDQSRQMEQDPGREGMRQELLKKWRGRIAESRGKRHIEDMSGQYDISQTIMYLFAKDGSPPPNIFLEDIGKQHKKLTANWRWLWAVSDELDRKLEKLDPGRYSKDKEKKRIEEQNRLEKKEKAYLDYLKDRPEALEPKVRDAIREAMQRRYKPRELKGRAARDPVNLRVLGVRQIERVLRYVFADYITNPLYAVTDGPDVQYQAISEELEAMNVMMSEIVNKLSELNELMDSSHAYLDVPD